MKSTKLFCIAALSSVALVASLAGCSDTSTKSDTGKSATQNTTSSVKVNSDPKKGWVVVGDDGNVYRQQLEKICDGPRLIYMNPRGDRFWFIENAPECA